MLLASRDDFLALRDTHLESTTPPTPPSTISGSRATPAFLPTSHSISASSINREFLLQPLSRDMTERSFDTCRDQSAITQA